MFGGSSSEPRWSSGDVALHREECPVTNQIGREGADLGGMPGGPFGMDVTERRRRASAT